MHQSVYSTYSVFSLNDEKFLQIDTYGRETRDLPEKSSQSFQIDKESAILLKHLLEETFDI